MKLADAVEVDTGALCEDAYSDLLEASAVHSQAKAPSQLTLQNRRDTEADVSYWPSWKKSTSSASVSLETDSVECLTVAPVRQSNEVVDLTNDDVDDVPNSEEVRIAKLFPNAFRLVGIKHICDNLLHALLKNLPQFLGSCFELFFLLTTLFCYSLLYFF